MISQDQGANELRPLSSRALYDALVLHEQDHVATAVTEITAGTEIIVQFADGRTEGFVVAEPIPFGHKFALVDIPNEAHILKYGESIGVASTAISAGSHVHVHNVDSQRGRGDLAGQMRKESP